KGVVTLPVLKGIEAAEKAGLKVKVNMVVKKGMNESQILPKARHFKGTNVILRYIGFMDVGNHNGWDCKNVVSKQEIVDTIHQERPLETAEPNYYVEVALCFEYKDGEGELGVISSVTGSFCDTCTRILLSADGKLYTCIFASYAYDLKSKLRNGMTAEELEVTITA